MMLSSRRINDLRANLEVRIDSVHYTLDTGELAHMIDSRAAMCKLRPKTKRVVLEMPKLNKATPWKRLTA